MKQDIIRTLFSVFLVIIGAIYFFIPKKTLLFIHRMNENYTPSAAAINRYRYVGLIIFGFGLYYFLTWLGYVPELKF